MEIQNIEEHDDENQIQSVFAVEDEQTDSEQELSEADIRHNNTTDEEKEKYLTEDLKLKRNPLIDTNEKMGKVLSILKRTGMHVISLVQEWDNVNGYEA